MSDEQEPTAVEYGLLVSFAGVYETFAEEAAYVNGYEAGIISCLLGTESKFQRTVHTENRVILQRECDARGYEVDFSPTTPPTDGWLLANFKKRPHKGHLAIVK